MSVTKSAQFVYEGKTYTCTLTLSGTWSNPGSITFSVSPTLSRLVYFHGRTGGSWVLEYAKVPPISYDNSKSHDCFSAVVQISNGEYWDRNSISGNCFIIDYPQTGTPTVTRQLPKLPAPTGLTKDNVTSNSARVGWNSVTNATDYKVEYRVQGATNWTEQQ